MKWQAKEIDTYLQSKEYVDTAIVPLIPISWNKEVKSTVAMGEFTSIMIDELERQFRGRMFQFPPFVYVKEEDINERIKRLHQWDEHFVKNGFVHIIYITSDIEWKNVEGELKDMLLWLPSIPLEHMHDKFKIQTVSDQIKQLLPIITNKWQNGPKERSN